MRGGEPRGSARGRDRGIRSATKAGSGAAIVSGAIEDIARRPRGSRREIGRARTRGAPRRRAPPSHNCLTTGALVRKSDGWGAGYRGARADDETNGDSRGKNRPGSCRGTRGVQRRADPSMRERAEGRALDQPRNACTRDTATWAKKKHSLDPTNPVARAPAGGGGDATSLDAPRRARTES